MRTVELAVGEYYHVFNRGVDKRLIALDGRDQIRFLRSMELFNSIQPIGSIHEHSFLERTDALSQTRKPLVNVVAYCVNPNHYHFLLEQVADNGIEKFMHRLGTGFTKYFNVRHQRTGSLFQGPFKAIRVDSDGYLLHVSAYVNLNNRVHRLSRSSAFMSSWEQYLGKGLSSTAVRCRPEVILDQFESPEAYEHFALRTLREIHRRRGISEPLLEQTAHLEA